MSTDKILSKIYYDVNSPAGYSSLKKLWIEARKQLPKLRLTRVKEWWTSQNIPSHFSLRKLKFSRATFITRAANNTYLADLADFSKLSKFNRGYKWLLIVEDLFSRKLKGLVALKSKTAKETAIALDRIFEKNRPKKFLTDQVIGAGIYFLRNKKFSFREGNSKANASMSLKNTVFMRILPMTSHRRSPPLKGRF